ncbi:MAG: hypothetical protein IIB82_16830 [Bacteroidetes bacterium]|nr:hypothetical protein [Bacteroidota bacterium]
MKPVTRLKPWQVKPLVSETCGKYIPAQRVVVPKLTEITANHFSSVL